MFWPDDPEEVGAGRAVSLIQQNRSVMTPIKWHPGRDDANFVPLIDGDQDCSECGKLIQGYRNAPYLLILARIKREYNETYCPDCLGDIKHREQCDTERENGTSPEQEVRA